MNAYVFAAQASANVCAATVDAQQGYPRAGVDVGGGVHVVPPFVTQTYQQVFANAGATQWAYPADAVSTPVLAASAVTLAGQGVNLPAPTPIDSTWTATASAVQSQQAAVGS